MGKYFRFSSQPPQVLSSSKAGRAVPAPDVKLLVDHPVHPRNKKIRSGIDSHPRRVTQDDRRRTRTIHLLSDRSTPYPLGLRVPERPTCGSGPKRDPFELRCHLCIVNQVGTVPAPDKLAPAMTHRRGSGPGAWAGGICGKALRGDLAGQPCSGAAWAHRRSSLVDLPTEEPDHSPVSVAHRQGQDLQPHQHSSGSSGSKPHRSSTDSSSAVSQSHSDIWPLNDSSLPPIRPKR